MKVKVWETTTHKTGIQKKKKMSSLFTDYANIKPRLIKRGKESHYILFKGKSQEVR